MASAPYLGKDGTLDLDDAIFGEEFHMPLVHETVKAEQNARRQGTASTKTRGEVNMTGAKAFRQKGTGRARAGALSTPNRVGGGIAFGPKPRHFVSKVNRKARRRALRCVLSEHARRGSLAIADPADFSTPSTKLAAGALAERGKEKTLVVCGREGDEAITKSFRNIGSVKVVPADRVGVCDIIGAPRLVLTPGAIDYLTTIARKREEAAA
ncbi:MAG: large subunit ribosomal protein [Thermoleophilaceae bacterium]|jgi:large subunit ribosomal protein L4|nr:large subunit ribosomal protein [Thermoleophilaceae bacterium]